MCFSATASITVGTTLAGVGILTLRSTRSWREVPLASVPLLFGLQQLAEGAVWRSLEGTGSATHHWSIVLYLVCALVLWPTLIPIAAWLVEPDPVRRLAIFALGVFGVGVSTYLATVLVWGNVTATAELRRIVYDLPPLSTPLDPLPYVAAACLPLLCSSLRSLNVFGALAAATYFVSNEVYTRTFVSVWCFMAAVVSIVVAAHFLRADGIGSRHAAALLSVQPDRHRPRSPGP